MSLLRSEHGGDRARTPRTLRARTEHNCCNRYNHTDTKLSKISFSLQFSHLCYKKLQLFSHPVIRSDSSESWRKSLFHNNFIFAYNCNFKTKKFCSLTTSLLSALNSCRAEMKYLHFAKQSNFTTGFIISMNVDN